MFNSPMAEAFITLIFAVGAIAVIFFLLKKYSKKLSPKLASKDIEVISRSSLTPKSHLYIVEVEGQKLLLGVTENSVNLVKEISEKPKNNSESMNLDNLSISPNEDISFKSFLKKAVLKK